MNFGNMDVRKRPAVEFAGLSSSNSSLLSAPEPKRTLSKTPFLFQSEAKAAAAAAAEKNKPPLESVENRPRENDEGASLPVFGQSIVEKNYFLTGNVERVIKWNKILKNRFSICYEVFETVLIKNTVPPTFSHYATKNCPRTSPEKRQHLTKKTTLFQNEYGELIIDYLSLKDTGRSCAACIVSVEDGHLPLQKLMLLRDNNGPILQVVHYVSNDVSGLHSFDFSVGQKLRVIGKMTEPNKLTAITLRLATAEEMTVIQRFCYIGDYAVSRLLGGN